MARHDDDTRSLAKLVKTLTVLRRGIKWVFITQRVERNSYFFDVTLESVQHPQSASGRTDAGILRWISPWFINPLFSAVPASPSWVNPREGRDLSSFRNRAALSSGRKRGIRGIAQRREGDSGNSVIVSSLSARLMRLPFPAVNFSGR